MDIENLNFKVIPKDVFLNGEKYVGDATFLNGFNGYDKSKEDSLMCALIDRSAWNGKGEPNLLTNSKGIPFHSDNRRGQSVTIN